MCQITTHHHLAVADLAQRARIFWSHADRGGSFLGQSRVVEHEDAIGHRMQGEQALDARFVQHQRVPGRVGQQVLLTLDGGSCDHVGDGVTRFMGQVSEQPREVALHAVSARVSSEQRGKRFQEGCQFGYGFG